MSEEIEGYENNLELELFIYRSSRFVRSVRVITYKDVNVEELSKPELDIP